MLDAIEDEAGRRCDSRRRILGKSDAQLAGSEFLGVDRGVEGEGRIIAIQRRARDVHAVQVIPGQGIDRTDGDEPDPGLLAMPIGLRRFPLSPDCQQPVECLVAVTSPYQICGNLAVDFSLVRRDREEAEGSAAPSPVARFSNLSCRSSFLACGHTPWCPGSDSSGCRTASKV